MRMRWWIGGYMIAMAAVLIAPFASPNPDGLEHVAENKGYIEKAQGPHYSIIADYAFPGVENEKLATLLAGWVGVTMVFVAVAGTSFIVSRVKASRQATG